MTQISEPALLLDKTICLANIKRMAEKAKAHNLIFRPHVKTHQSVEIANYFRGLGIDKITVSSLKQAVYFAENGWEDITVAFPVNILELKKIKFLSSRIKLNLLVESVFVIEFLKEHLESPVNVFIKIDVGYHRTGVDPNDSQLINSILSIINSSNNLEFLGFLCHAGHSYNAKTIEEIKAVHEESQIFIRNLKEKYLPQYPYLIASVGDTPTNRLMTNFDFIDEIRPGTFVFYDLAQWKLGTCLLNQIAIAMACPVVALHPLSNEVVIYGGAVHFSKDFSILPSGEKYYGFVVEFNGDNWNVNNILGILKSVSQEHGIVKFNSKIPRQIKEGSILTILPIHSCLTGNLMKKYITLNGGTIDRL